MSETETHRLLGEIKGTLDALVRRIDARDGRDGALEDRVRKVEHRQHWWSGGGAVLGAIAGALGMHLRGG